MPKHGKYSLGARHIQWDQNDISWIIIMSVISVFVYDTGFDIWRKLSLQDVNFNYGFAISLRGLTLKSMM